MAEPHRETVADESNGLQGEELKGSFSSEDSNQLEINAGSSLGSDEATYESDEEQQLRVESSSEGTLVFESKPIFKESGTERRLNVSSSFQWPSFFASKRKRKEMMKSFDGLRLENGESAEALIKKLKEIKTRNVQVESLAQLKKQVPAVKPRKLRAKKINSGRIVMETNTEEKHGYAYKPSFFSRRLLFLNKAF